MESSLHRELKERYAAGGRSEFALDGFRVDAMTADGRVIEVQSGGLAPLRPKLVALLPSRRVQVVKPVILSRRLVRRSSAMAGEPAGRWSPKRGSLSDVFADLTGLAPIFPHEHLTVEVVGVSIDEIREPCRRAPGYRVVDRRLREVVEAVALREPADLWGLLPTCFEGRFTTRELAAGLGRPREFAQKVAYCLRRAGAVADVGKRGNSRIYLRADGIAPAGPATGVRLGSA